MSDLTWFSTSSKRFSLRCGDALECVKAMPKNSVDCVVTSPPYWGLRDYGVEGQMGIESSHVEYLDRMVALFDEIRRVLAADGTCWVNMGDSYAGSIGGNDGNHGGLNRWRKGGRTMRKQGPALKPKDLVGMPWRLALALQESGWYLRSDIIWHKPTCVPESVRDRPTKAHEYLFMLTKSARYHYDADAIREPVTGTSHPRRAAHVTNWHTGDGPHTAAAHQKGTKYERHQASKPKIEPRANPRFMGAVWNTVESRNARSVWTIRSEPLAEEHFAAFPKELVRRCVLAGCKWEGTVFDPFTGSGTTGIVAMQLGRSFVGVELSPEYFQMAARRIRAAELEYLGGPMFAHQQGTRDERTAP